MRPKKIVLCVIPNEQQLSVLKFMLETNGYQVIAETTEIEAINSFKAKDISLVLIDMEMPLGGKKLVERMKGAAPHVPIILLSGQYPLPIGLHCADAMLAKKTVSSEELLLRIKVMSARKRGPRSGSMRPLPVQDAVAV